MGYIDSQLSRYLGVTPEVLSDEQWAEKYAQLLHIRSLEAGRHGAI